MKVVETLYIIITLVIGVLSFFLYYNVVQKLKTPSISASHNDKNKLLVRLFILNGFIWILFHIPYSVCLILFSYMTGFILSFFVCETEEGTHLAAIHSQIKCAMPVWKVQTTILHTTEAIMKTFAVFNCIFLVILTRPFRDFFNKMWRKILKNLPCRSVR